MSEPTPEHHSGEPAETPHLVEYGPFDLPGRLPGIDGPETTIGCDSSVETISGSDGRQGGRAVWATVSGDGRAQFGWYEAAASTTSDAAELVAIRHALARYPASPDAAPIKVITDSQVSAKIVRRIASGEWPLNRSHRFAPHSGLLAALRDEVLARPFTLVSISGDGDRRLPGHSLPAAAHRVAWLIRRLLTDGAALDDEVLFKVVDLASAAGQRRTNIVRAYLRWRRREAGRG